ncbi:hypothetical protein ACQKWADRAFT_327356 [Trichoderma austrokoningii]
MPMPNFDHTRVISSPFTLPSNMPKHYRQNTRRGRRWLPFTSPLCNACLFVTTLMVLCVLLAAVFPWVMSITVEQKRRHTAMSIHARKFKGIKKQKGNRDPALLDERYQIKERTAKKWAALKQRLRRLRHGREAEETQGDEELGTREEPVASGAADPGAKDGTEVAVRPAADQAPPPESQSNAAPNSANLTEPQAAHIPEPRIPEPRSAERGFFTRQRLRHPKQSIAEVIHQSFPPETQQGEVQGQQEGQQSHELQDLRLFQQQRELQRQQQQERVRQKREQDRQEQRELNDQQQSQQIYERQAQQHRELRGNRDCNVHVHWEHEPRSQQQGETQGQRRCGYTGQQQGEHQDQTQDEHQDEQQDEQKKDDAASLDSEGLLTPRNTWTTPTVLDGGESE